MKPLIEFQHLDTVNPLSLQLTANAIAKIVGKQQNIAETIKKCMDASQTAKIVLNTYEDLQFKASILAAWSLLDPIAQEDLERSFKIIVALAKYDRGDKINLYSILKKGYPAPIPLLKYWEEATKDKVR